MSPSGAMLGSGGATWVETNFRKRRVVGPGWDHPLAASEVVLLVLEKSRVKQ